jgi:hypothetical protein
MESKDTPRRRITSKRPPPSAPEQEVEAPGEFKSSIDPKQKEIIERVYFDDLTGYRSIRDTWKQAREIDPDIKLKDVSQWKAELEPRKTQVAGYNCLLQTHPIRNSRWISFSYRRRRGWRGEEEEEEEGGGRGGGGGGGGGG